MNTSDLQRFLDATSTVERCQCCGKDEWTHIEPPNQQTAWSIQSFQRSGGQIFPAPAIPVVVLVCRHCGFVRPHAEVVIQRWLDNNKGTA